MKYEASILHFKIIKFIANSNNFEDPYPCHINKLIKDKESKTAYLPQNLVVRYFESPHDAITGVVW